MKETTVLLMVIITVIVAVVGVVYSYNQSLIYGMELAKLGLQQCVNPVHPSREYIWKKDCNE